MRSIILVAALLLLGCQRIDDLGALVPPTVDQDANLPSISVNVAGRQRLVHVRTFGSPANPPLFILHGSFTDTRPYRNICEALADKYYVVIWDQRGCGLSERITEDEFTLQSAVDEINALKAIYAPDRKVTIVGQSWGGGLATLYTSQNPEKVEQLLLMEPMPLTGDDMQKLFKTIVQFRYDNGTWNNLARHGQAISPQDHEQIDYRAMMILRSTMTKGYHCDGNNPPEWPIHRVGGFLEYVRNKRLGNPLSGFAYDFTQGIQNYRDTVLILGGSCSSLGYAMQQQYSKPHFPNAEVVEIKDVGHRMNMEKFDEVMSAIKSFLRAY
ncbi:MAG: alpha/beta fold hydrolase [Saprospiraceae bacterium]